MKSLTAFSCTLLFLIGMSIVSYGRSSEEADPSSRVSAKISPELHQLLSQPPDSLLPVIFHAAQGTPWRQLVRDASLLPKYLRDMAN